MVIQPGVPLRLPPYKWSAFGTFDPFDWSNRPPTSADAWGGPTGAGGTASVPAIAGGVANVNMFNGGFRTTPPGGWGDPGHPIRAPRLMVLSVAIGIDQEALLAAVYAEIGVSKGVEVIVTEYSNAAEPIYIWPRDLASPDEFTTDDKVAGGQFLLVTVGAFQIQVSDFGITGGFGPDPGVDESRPGDMGASYWTLNRPLIADYAARYAARDWRDLYEKFAGHAADMATNPAGDPPPGWYTQGVWTPGEIAAAVLGGLSEWSYDGVVGADAASIAAYAIPIAQAFFT